MLHPGTYIGPIAASWVPFYSANNGLQTDTKHACMNSTVIQNKMANMARIFALLGL